MFSEYDENFEIAHKPVEAIEGGFVDHPNDPGGVTNFGISLRFLEEFANTKKGDDLLFSIGIYNADRLAIEQMSKQQSKEIYYHAFWKNPKIDKLPLPLAVVTYDFAVNSGIPYAVKLLQRAIHEDVDGFIGKNTIKKAQESRHNKVIELMLTQRVEFYKKLAVNPKYKVFLAGWLNRVTALQKYVHGLQYGN